MSYDYEDTYEQYKKQIEDREKAQEQVQKLRRAEFSEICTDLERILETPNPSIDTLARQADLLDCALYALMRHNLSRDKENGHFDYDNLARAVALQKQCVNTVKAASAVNYMNRISAKACYPNTVPYAATSNIITTDSDHPSPLKHDERNDETEKA